MLDTGIGAVGILLGLTVTFLFILWYFRDIFKFKMPPGPWGLPVVGYLPFLGTQPQETFLRLQEKYGGFYTVQIGSFQCIVVNGRRAIKDMLLNSAGVFDTRPEFYSNVSYKRKLAFGEYSEKWLVLKTVVVDRLSKFADSKDTAVERLLEEEAALFLKDIEGHNGKPFDPKTELYDTIGSVLYQVLYGRVEHIRDDKEFRKLLTLEKAYADHTKSSNLVEFMPWLAKLSQSLVKPIHELMDHHILVQNSSIVEHRKSFSKSRLRDLTDTFLDVEGNETQEMKSVSLTAEDLLHTLEEIFSFGVHPTVTTMRWIVSIMVRFPLVQRQVYDEIERVIGDRSPTLNDKLKMPYTEAVILETMRFKTPMPLGTPHCTVKHARIGTFVVPKGTPVIFNLHSLARDADIWQHPNGFYPEQFLTADGQVDREKIAQISPFGMGKRKCFGDLIARNSIFLCLVKLVQKFEVIPVDGEEYDLTGINGLTDCPKPFKIIALER